jgi:uncharacterized protein (TIGR03067 family)
MKTTMILLLMTLFGHVAQGPEKDRIQAEMQKLQGTWILERMTPDFNKKGSLTLVIKDDQFTISFDLKTPPIEKGTFKIDPTKEPATIDLTYTHPDEMKGKTSLSIYSLKEDRLMMCVPRPGVKRPTEFSTSRGQVVREWSRQKPK